MINQHREGQESHVVDQFEATDLGAPFRVILKNCVKVISDIKTGEMVSYTIPDPDGLLRVVVLTRILDRRKLFGGDIKFLRKAVGVMQKDLAKSIGVSAEHLCRCEAGSLPLTPSSEKLLRLFMFKTVIKHHKIKDGDAKSKIEDILDRLFDELEPVCAHDINDELEFVFTRSARQADNFNDDDEPEYELDLAA